MEFREAIIQQWRMTILAGVALILCFGFALGNTIGPNTAGRGRNA